MLQGELLQYFWPSLSYHLSLRSCFVYFWVAVLHRFYCTCMNCRYLHSRYNYFYLKWNHLLYLSLIFLCLTSNISQMQILLGFASVRAIIHSLKLVDYLPVQTQLTRNSYTMGCPPVRGDNPRALASGLSYVQVEKPWYNYFIPPSSV